MITNGKRGTKRKRGDFDKGFTHKDNDYNTQKIINRGASQIAIVNDPSKFLDWLKVTLGEDPSRYSSFWQNYYKLCCKEQSMLRN